MMYLALEMVSITSYVMVAPELTTGALASSVQLIPRKVVAMWDTLR